MRSILAIAAVSAMGVMAQRPFYAPGSAASRATPAPKAPVAAAPSPKAAPPPAPKAAPAPLAWEGVRNPGPGVVPDPGVTLPDLSAEAARFQPGPEVNSSKLLSQGKVGTYSVGIIENAAFPNRTVYLPLNVPIGTRVPIFAWENGSCKLYGRMYQAFLQEIASHGYLVIAPGSRDKQDEGRSTADWQIKSIAYARNWTASPFYIDGRTVAVGGHSCGGGETARNLATFKRGEVKTGLIFNSVGQNEDLRKINVPMLWVHGGQTDTEDRASDALSYLSRARPELPVALVGLQTGHLGSFWWPRGGIYAETAVKWLNAHLKNNATDKAFFVGESKSPAAARGWALESNNLEAPPPPPAPRNSTRLSPNRPSRPGSLASPSRPAASPSSLATVAPIAPVAPVKPTTATNLATPTTPTRPTTSPTDPADPTDPDDSDEDDD